MRKALIPTAAALVLASGSASATEKVSERDMFELWNGCRPIRVGVVVEHQDTSIILTKSQIETAVRSRLRAARLYAGSREPGQSMLWIFVHTIRQSFSTAFLYYKGVTDIRSQRTMLAVTWRNPALGTHGGDEGYILSTVREQADWFVDEYLRVNGPACRKSK